MKRIQSSKVAKIFITTLIITGIIFGILYFNWQSEINKSVIITQMQGLKNIVSSSHQNMIITHLITTVILLFLAYSIIGMPLILFYLFYECTSIGFLLASFYASFKLKGLIFGLIYTLLCKTLYILCLIYITYIALKISKKLLRTLILKENDSLYVHLKGLFTKLAIVFVGILIYDLFLYFFANPILKLFLFLI